MIEKWLELGGVPLYDLDHYTAYLNEQSKISNQSKSTFFCWRAIFGTFKDQILWYKTKSIGKVVFIGVLLGILPYRIRTQDKYQENSPSFCALQNHLKPPKTMLKLIFVTFITQLNQKCQFEHLWVYKGLNKKVKLGDTPDCPKIH